MSTSVGVYLFRLDLLYINTVLSVCVFFYCRSMAPPAQPNFALKSILEKDKLNGTNFTTWYRNLRIVLKHDKKEHVLENPLPDEPAKNANATTRNAYQKFIDESMEISCTRGKSISTIEVFSASTEIIGNE